MLRVKGEKKKGEEGREGGSLEKEKALEEGILGQTWYPKLEQGHALRPVNQRTRGVEEEEATLRGAPVNTFSDVVICRWFRPAGGQPFFHAFLRLPDLNPLKRLEQLFRVISSKGVGEVKLSEGWLNSSAEGEDAKHLGKHRPEAANWNTAA